MNKIAKTTSALALSLILGSVAVGCAAGPGGAGSIESVDQATALLASDGTQAVSSDDHSTAAMTDAAFDVVLSADPSVASAALASAPADPADGNCRTRAKDPNDPSTVIITLNDCTGRFGQRHVSGTEIVHFTKGEGGVLHADFHSENLTAFGRPASHTASADITFNGTERDIAWQGQWEGTTENGEAISHQSDLSVVVDTVAHCRTRNGTAVTKIGDRQIDTQIEDLQVCRGADGAPSCPSGTVIHTNEANGRQITVAFDGSDQALVTGPKGKTFDKQLACGG